MKKLLLFAVLLNGVSFSSMASNTPNKKGEPSSRIILKEASIRDTNESTKSKPQSCGFKYFEIGCGGGNDFLGSAYVCDGDGGAALISRKLDVYDQYCG